MIGDDFVKLKIVLTEEERRGLERLADEQLRAPWEQVRWIIRQELIRGVSCLAKRQRTWTNGTSRECIHYATRLA